MGDNTQYFLTLFLGLFMVIKYKWLSKFLYKNSMHWPTPISEKWNIRISQFICLFIGSLTILFSVVKLTSVFF